MLYVRCTTACMVLVLLLKVLLLSCPDGYERCCHCAPQTPQLLRYCRLTGWLPQLPAKQWPCTEHWRPAGPCSSCQAQRRPRQPSSKQTQLEGCCLQSSACCSAPCACQVTGVPSHTAAGAAPCMPPWVCMYAGMQRATCCYAEVCTCGCGAACQIHSR